SQRDHSVTRMKPMRPRLGRNPNGVLRSANRERRSRAAHRRSVIGHQRPDPAGVIEVKRSAFLSPAALLPAALVTVLAGTSRAVAVDRPQPDLTGYWLGFVVSESDPPSEHQEAAALVDFQKRNRIAGKLALGGL